MFTRLRNDSPDEAVERGDVIAGLAFAAGVAAALGAGGDELRDLDALDSLVWIFLTGLTLGFVLYWVVGGALAFVVRRLGGSGEPHRARHVLAFSFAPLVFAIALWLIWPPLLLGLAAWSLVLLLLGLREVYGWSLARAGSAVVLALVWLGALGVGLLSVLALLRSVSE
ncbi:MAG: YIP1 family protein [Gaiellaceae bacterium]